jgi:hypothetical protein
MDKGDNWRRTANGWERTTNWRPVGLVNLIRPPADPHATKPADGSRIDTHPAALALVEIVGALVALYVFPAQHSELVWAARNLPAAISRSFRASAFG